MLCCKSYERSAFYPCNREKLIKNDEEIFVRLRTKYVFSGQEIDLKNRLFPVLRKLLQQLPLSMLLLMHPQL